MKTDAEVLTEVNRLIDEYHPKAGLDSLSKFLLSFAALRHPSVKMHMARVALIAHNAASNSNDLITPKPAFFGGLFHDIGKLVLPDYLFSGREINEEEYAQIKEHAVLGFEALKDHHFYTALCAGMHHAFGRLYNTVFTRAWYYWVVCGVDMPLADANELYEDPVGRKDIRVAGYAGNASPEKWVENVRSLAGIHEPCVCWYHVDSQEGLNMLVAKIREVVHRTTGM